MPRSVNAVASRARRKKILKLTRGQFGRRKNARTVAKNSWEKGQGYAYRDRRAKNAASAPSGSPVSMPAFASSECLTQLSWVLFTNQESNYILEKGELKHRRKARAGRRI